MIYDICKGGHVAGYLEVRNSLQRVNPLPDPEVRNEKCGKNANFKLNNFDLLFSPDA